ncbi:hypothetical protein FRB96_003214 [Tulasnella sp. 330]|nr:hypothetical protein FRB96_003214 [Tulasnella sp. 330]KAG8876364.1 hypothetical protein FRB97_004264 [Tulasnella sp. 331]KAG8884012.1 hypothetical protein FRB98_002653 [Tulasnella sp. 332]
MFTETDPADGRPVNYQTISCVPEYRNHSFEELRLHYYQHGAPPATPFTITTTLGKTPKLKPLFTEEDPANGSPLYYQSITCIPQYRDQSFEELRVYYNENGVPPATTPPPLTTPPTTIILDDTLALLFTEEDPAAGHPLYYQSITCIPKYRHQSFEELRVHYNQHKALPATPPPPPPTTPPTTTIMLGNVPELLFTEKDPTNEHPLYYQSVTCLPKYRHQSFEELRVHYHQHGVLPATPPPRPRPQPPPSVPSTKTITLGNTPELLFAEKDPADGRPLHYQSITCISRYQYHSFEELRVQHYQYGDTMAPLKTFFQLQPRSQPMFPPPPMTESNPAASSGLFGPGQGLLPAVALMGFNTTFSWQNLHHVRGLADMTIAYPFS